MKLCIKNMVGNHCKMVVSEELKKLGLHSLIIDLGEVEIMESITPELFDQLKMNLLMNGLDLVEDRRSSMIEKIKNEIKGMVQEPDVLIHKSFADRLVERLETNYLYLSNLFAESEGISIKQFFILSKIERIKQLIIDDKLSITEIAWKMNYSSASHLSNQFKKITGVSPSQFKQLEHKKGIQVKKISGSPEINVKPSALKKRDSKPKRKSKPDISEYAFGKKIG